VSGARASSTRSGTCSSSSWQRTSSTSSSTNRLRYQSLDWSRVALPWPISQPTSSLLCPSTTPQQRATCLPTSFTAGSCLAFSIPTTTADPSTINPSGRLPTSTLQRAGHQLESRPRHATGACTALNRESQMSFHTSISNLTLLTNKSHIKITRIFPVQFSLFFCLYTSLQYLITYFK